MVLFLDFAWLCLFKNAFGQRACVFLWLESKVLVVNVTDGPAVLEQRYREQGEMVAGAPPGLAAVQVHAQAKSQV